MQTAWDWAFRIYEAWHWAAWHAYQELVIENQLLSWQFYALVALLLLLERLQPVQVKPRILSASFFHDCLWFIVGAMLIGVFSPLLWAFLWTIYHSHLAFLRIETVDAFPIPLQIILAILLNDFVRWFHHVLRHKVPFFWYFHAVHHSQEDINPFTDLRVHPVERIIETVVSFVPFFSLRPDIALSSLAAWNLFGVWYARFYHSNVRTNLGWLRYVLVTPQSHRIHHSRKPEHGDRNFGAIFSIWDQLFATQCRQYDEYPETGIKDTGFPHERAVGLRATVSVFVLQLVYPFKLALGPAASVWRRQPLG